MTYETINERLFTMEIKKIAVLGAGQMGNGIAQVCAQAGYEVTMRDIAQKFLDNGMQRL
jgi:3-hydroxyacyl-CoA dehydrogenase